MRIWMEISVSILQLLHTVQSCYEPLCMRFRVDFLWGGRNGLEGHLVGEQCLFKKLSDFFFFTREYMI